MLFFLDESIAEAVSQEPVPRAEIEAINYLAMAAAEGAHRITAQRRVLNALLACSNLDYRTRALFKSAAAQVAQDHGLMRDLPVHVRVMHPLSSIACSSVNEKRIIQVPLRWFDHSSKVQPTSLLGENLSDVSVLKLFGKMAAASMQSGYIPLAETPVAGGGATTAQVLSSQIEQHRFCLCVVDSDRSHPGAPLGSTATAVMRFDDQAQYPGIQIVTTIGRDLENALPDIFFQTSYGTLPAHAQTVLLLQNLTGSGQAQIRAHLDMEMGFCLRNLYLANPGSAERLFWDQGTVVISNALGIELASLPCNATGICSEAAQIPSRPCSCILVPRNGDNMLNRFFTRFGTTDGHQLGSYLDAAVRDEWIRIGELVVGWCCGSKRLRL